MNTKSTTKSKRVLTRKRSEQRKKEHMSNRTNQELGAAYLSTQWRAWGASTALGCVLWFVVPHSPSSSNGDDNGKTSEEHSGASRAMAELQRNAAELLE